MSRAYTAERASTIRRKPYMNTPRYPFLTGFRKQGMCIQASTGWLIAEDVEQCFRLEHYPWVDEGLVIWAVATAEIALWEQSPECCRAGAVLGVRAFAGW